MDEVQNLYVAFYCSIGKHWLKVYLFQAIRLNHIHTALQQPL